jgi:hypothetical protein
MGWWLTGMQSRLHRAAQPVGGLLEDLARRGERIERVLSDLSNTLIDVHTGRLLRADMTMPAGLFWAEAQGVDIDVDFPDAIDDAMRPRALGRANALLKFVLQGMVIRPWLRLTIWLGFVAPFEWVPREYREAAPPGREPTD